MKVVFLLVFIFVLLKATEADKKPNILFILAGKINSLAFSTYIIINSFSNLHASDDLGYGDLASYPNPNTTRMRLLTPHVDGKRCLADFIWIEINLAVLILKFSSAKRINDVH